MTDPSLLVCVLLQLRVVTLAEAVRSAETHQPGLRQARAASAGAEAKVEQARSYFLPQVTGQLAYQRTTANWAPRPGALPHGFSLPSSSSSLDTYNYFSGSLTLSQWLFDFGQTIGRYRAARDTLGGYRQTERATRAQLVLKVRLAYFEARANRELLEVAREALANQLRHQQQVEGFVQVGTKPTIDLAQARTDVANARLQVIKAENAFRTSKAQLRAIMGRTDVADFDVSDETLPPIEGEDRPGETLVAQALRARPELGSLESQVRAQEATIRSARGTYWPALGLSTALTEAGSELDAMAWNWYATVSMSWSLFQGGYTRGQVREGLAALDTLQAKLADAKQQIVLEIVQAQLALRAAKESRVASGEAVLNARERLRLAEARYATGAGHAIEVGDAQAKLTDASAQQVIANYSLASARAQLAAALGVGSPR